MRYLARSAQARWSWSKSFIMRLMIASNAERAPGESPSARSTANASSTSKISVHALCRANRPLHVRNDLRMSELPRRSIRSTGTDLRNQKTGPRRYTKDDVDLSKEQTLPTL